MQIFPFPIFHDFVKKTYLCSVFLRFMRFCIFCAFAFYAINFEPIKNKNHKVPLNERLNLSFVKDIYVVGKKMTRNGRKTVICHSQILENRLFLILYTSLGNFTTHIAILNAHKSKQSVVSISWSQLHIHATYYTFNSPH